MELSTTARFLEIHFPNVMKELKQCRISLSVYIYVRRAVYFYLMLRKNGHGWQTMAYTLQKASHDMVNT